MALRLCSVPELVSKRDASGCWDASGSVVFDVERESLSVRLNPTFFGLAAYTCVPAAYKQALNGKYFLHQEQN